jgi:DNA transformation protein
VPCARTFVDHALDLLSSLELVEARRMFGGYGIYVRGVMLGLLDDDELFLKTDAETRQQFLAAGCRMWVYPGTIETHYYRPPDEAHEDAEAMAPWARLALDAALRARTAKVAKAAASAARKATRETKPASRSRPTRRKPPKPKRKATGGTRRARTR